MNPTQTVCFSCREPLPKVGGIEIRVHRADGKTAYYTCGRQRCAVRVVGSILKLSPKAGGTGKP